jgi:hypothetical protein
VEFTMTKISSISFINPQMTSPAAPATRGLDSGAQSHQLAQGTAHALASPKLTNKSGFRITATSSQTPLDFLGIKQKNAGSRLRDNVGGVKRSIPATLDSIGGPLDLTKPSVPIGSKAAPLRGVFGQDMNSPMETMFRKIGGYVEASPATQPLRSTPAATGRLNAALAGPIDVLFGSIGGPLRGTPRELATKDLINGTQPIAGTRSELAMKDMLNGIEPVQQTAASLLNGIEPVKPSVTRVLDSIGPLKPTTTSLLDGVRDSWKQRLLPTDSTRLAAGNELRSNLRGEASMEFVRNLSPFAPLGNNGVAHDTQSLPQAAEVADSAKLGVAQHVALRNNPVSLDTNGLDGVRKNVGSAKPTAEGNSQPVGFFTNVSAMKQPASGQMASSYSRQTVKGADPARSAEIDAAVDALPISPSRWGARGDAETSIQQATDILDQIRSGEHISAQERDGLEIRLRGHLHSNPDMVPDQRNRAAALANQLRELQDVNVLEVPGGPEAPDQLVDPHLTQERT